MDMSSTATKGDVALVKDDLTELKKSLKRLHDADDQILTILINMDKRLSKKVDNHEHRIVRLERSIA